MKAKERYEKGLITLSELAESNPVAALSALEREHKREMSRLQETVKAMQCQLDALTDAMYDKEQ